MRYVAKICSRRGLLVIVTVVGCSAALLLLIRHVWTVENRPLVKGDVPLHQSTIAWDDELNVAGTVFRFDLYTSLATRRGIKRYQETGDGSFLRQPTTFDLFFVSDDRITSPWDLAYFAVRAYMRDQDQSRSRLLIAPEVDNPSTRRLVRELFPEWTGEIAVMREDIDSVPEFDTGYQRFAYEHFADIAFRLWPKWH